MAGSWSKLIFLQFFFSLCASRSVKEDNFALNIIHMNDVHAHFDEISLNAGKTVFSSSKVGDTIYLRTLSPGRTGKR